QPDVDEGALHAGQHPHHAPQVDVADMAALDAALDVQFLDRALFHQGDSRFEGSNVDQDVFSHSLGVGHHGPDRIVNGDRHVASIARLVPSAAGPYRTFSRRLKIRV